MATCSRCGRRSRGEVCAGCRDDLRTEDAEWKEVNAADAGRWGDVRVELTFDDLRPEAAAALHRLVEMEGATIDPALLR